MINNSTLDLTSTYASQDVDSHMLQIRLLTISLYQSVDIIINFYFLVLVVMNLSVGTGCQASFDAWGVEEMRKAEEYALALRERFAGE